MIAKSMLAVSAACAALCASAGANAAAPAPAYGFSGAPVSSDTQLHLGFVFTPTKDINVSALGYYDDGGDGFLTEHQLGIFDSSGALLTATTLGAGQTGTLGANDFRYAGIAPLKLIAGQSYTVAGTSPSTGTNDPWVYGGPSEISGFTTSPDVTIAPDAARYTYGGGTALIDPSSHFADYQIYAVNFLSAGVPEPASWALMIAGFGLAGGAIRARRRPVALAA